MKIVPTNSHFFKPIISPSFKKGINIPKGFLKYLKNEDQYEYAILRRADKKWRVKVNGRRLEEGWDKFAEEHDLQEPDILVFRHEGNMEFEVSILDFYLQCEREYKGKGPKAQNVEETSNNFESKGSTSKAMVARTPNEAYMATPLGPTCFVCTIRPYWLKSNYLCLPKRFVLDNNLIMNKRCDLIIRDEKQRSWNLSLISYNYDPPRVNIGGDGWRKFCVGNELKEEDEVMFEIVTNGEKPIWQFYISKIIDGYKSDTLKVVHFGEFDTSTITILDSPSNIGEIYRQTGMVPKHKIKLSRMRSPLEVEVVTDKPSILSYFVRTVKPYCLTRDSLIIPKKFALENGLFDIKIRDLIVKDERGRSWNVILRAYANSVYLRSGWENIRDANFLKEGDRIKFEVVSNGNVPIWKFCGKISEEDTSNIQEDDDCTMKLSVI